MELLDKILNFEIVSFAGYRLYVYSFLAVFVIFLSTNFVLWLIKKSLFRKKHMKRLDEGNLYAVYQIVKYVVWLIAFSLVLETIGVKISILLASSAALLVGVGLGLQQTFNDVVSGIILLSERSIKIEDVLEIDGEVVKIKEIGLRTSRGLDLSDISIIIPNSLITTNKVINWSHQTKKTRFSIDNIHVSYDADIELVLRILEECTYEHPDVVDRKQVEARLENFKKSYLECRVLFLSENIFCAAKVKSDIRRKIKEEFKRKNITMALPQLDIHLRP
jgi:small-conductance mechanosensitive channel